MLKGSVQGKKTGVFEWTGEAEHAFRTLIAAFTTAPVLRHFDPSLKIRLETDASGFALAAVISQLFPEGWHPIAFWSRKMIPAEYNYKTHD